jgi:hypothetical protein
MIKSIKLKILLSFLIFCVYYPVLADERIYNPNADEYFDYDDSLDKPWVEDKLAQIPAINNDRLKLLELDNPPIGFDVYIDLDSISVSKSDRIVRYWLVFKSGKSRNAMYEGMKCVSSEFKTYAYESKWKKNKANINPQAKWQAIPRTGHQGYLNELREYYFCSDVLARPLSDILDIIAGYKSTTGEYDPTYHYAQ